MFKKSLNKITILVVITFIISCENQKQDLKLPSIFSDNMVLQQKTNVSFWGTSNSNERITINPSWGVSKFINANNKGEWELKLKTPEAGGPYQIEVKSDSQTVVYNDVLIGEVWIASGQSNMGMRLSDGIENQDEEIKNANYNDIRFFSVLEDLTGQSIKHQKWLKTTPENAEKYSAAAYFFARKLHKELKTPIGIVNTSWGGTRVEAWTSNDKLTKLESTKNKVPKIQDYEAFENKLKKLNDSINKINEEKFGFKTNDVPKWTEDEDLWERFIEDWANLDLEDSEYKNFDFDDSQWKYWRSKYQDYGGGELYKSEGRFESAFEESNTLLSDGVIWFRTKVNITDVNQDHFLIINNGIDDADQTYFKGKLIGNTFSWNRERN